jgi:hypothetical protein
LENRFATAELYGKLANIDADMSKEALKNAGILKLLVETLSQQKKSFVTELHVSASNSVYLLHHKY